MLSRWIQSCRSTRTTDNIPLVVDRIIQSYLHPKVFIKARVIVQFLHKYNIRLRAEQRSKNKSKASMMSGMQHSEGDVFDRIVTIWIIIPSVWGGGGCLHLVKGLTYYHLLSMLKRPMIMWNQEKDLWLCGTRKK